MPSFYNTLFLVSLPFTFALNAERRQAVPADFSSLPSCGQSCLIGAATSGTAGCPITDFMCLANSASFKSSVMKCVISSCSQEDMLNIAKWATKTSAALGIPLQLPSAVPSSGTSSEEPTASAKEKPDDSKDKPTPPKEQHLSDANTDYNPTPAKSKSGSSNNNNSNEPTPQADHEAEGGPTTSKYYQSSSKDAQDSPKTDYTATGPSGSATSAAGMSLPALDFASLPKCGQTCLISSVTTSGGSCAMTDIACLTASSEFKAAVAKCFLSSCSSTDATASIQWSLKAAASLGGAVHGFSAAEHPTNATIGASTDTPATINNTTLTPISSGSMMNTSTSVGVMPTTSLSSPPTSAQDSANSSSSRLATTSGLFLMSLTIILVSCLL